MDIAAIILVLANIAMLIGRQKTMRTAGATDMTAAEQILPPTRKFGGVTLTIQFTGFIAATYGFGSMTGNYLGGDIKDASGSFQQIYIVALMLAFLLVCLAAFLQKPEPS